MVTAIRMEYDYLLKTPHLIKKDDPGVPTILCSINKCYFYNTICDTGSGINITAKVTWILICFFAFGPYLCAATVGGIVLSLCGWDSQKCPNLDWRPLCPHWLLSRWHGRRIWSTYHHRKTVPQHYQSHHIHWNLGGPFPIPLKDDTPAF